MKQTKKHIQKLVWQRQIRVLFYLGIFFLLVAIPFTILSSQKRQVFQPLAANTSPSFFCEGSHNGICATPSTPSTSPGPTASSLPTITSTPPTISTTPSMTTQSVTANTRHHRQAIPH